MDSYYNMSEQGDSSSAEEVESPRSVVTAASGRRRKNERLRKNYVLDRYMMSNVKNRGYLHSQVLRVREEELQIGEYLMGDFGIYKINYAPFSLDDIWSRTVLPASPLGYSQNRASER